jgi:hypothetical protein
MNRALVVSVLILIVTAGCTAKKPFVIWQKNVEQYIADQGAGDPNVIRDTMDIHAKNIQRPALITFGGLLSDPDNPLFWAKSYANGVLLRQEKIDVHHWFFFLVAGGKGVSEIEDIRLIGFTPDPFKEAVFHWQMSEENRGALEQYMSVFPVGDQMAGFPLPYDIFGLDVNGYKITATEKRSGAIWELHLHDDDIKGK